MLGVLKYHTILYVEDEPDIRANIAEYLRSYFGTVYLAGDGEKALACYRKHRPDVLLLDINLPKIDGLEVAKTIRAMDSSVRILMLTAHTDTSKLLAATELKLTRYLIKPVDPRFFKETMEIVAEELLQNEKRYIQLGEHCSWDNQRKVLQVEGKKVALTAREGRLLQLLIDKRGQTVAYADIMLAVWEDALDREISIDSVKNKVSQLRKKLTLDCIQSIYGVGYTLK